MNDPYVRLGWQILRAIPQDGSDRSYQAVLAVHSLVWELWKWEGQPRREPQNGGSNV